MNCLDCNKKLSKEKYKRCHSCAQRAKGKKFFCIDCKKSVSRNSKRCHSCNAKHQWKDENFVTFQRERNLGDKNPTYGKKMIKHSERMTGPQNPAWKGGTTTLQVSLRNLSEYHQWRTNLFKRDHYTCCECGSKGYIESHHTTKTFSLLIKEFLQHYSQFSVLEEKEILLRLAISWEPFWNAEGKTLCTDCHKQERVH